MAQIQVPNFGTAVADPAGGVQVGQTDVSSGLSSVGNDMMNLGAQITHQQNNAKASLALATATNQAHDANQEVTQGLLSGAIAPEDAQAELKQRLDNIQQVQTDGLPPMQTSMVKTALVGTAGDLSRQLGGTVFKYQESQSAATIDALGAQLQQDAQRRGPGAAADTYDAVMQMTGGAAGFTPDQQQAKMREFRQNTTAGYYDDKGAALHAAGDLPGVTATLNEVLGDAGGQMNPLQRAQVTNHLVGLQNHLVAAQQRDADQAERDRVARENVAADAYNASMKVVTDGSYLSPDAIADLSMKTAGTSMEKPTTLLLASQTAVAGFASLPADQRAAQLEHYRSEGANPAVGTSPQNQASIAMLTKVDSKIDAMVKDDPWKAAQTYGVITNAPAMNLTNADNAMPLLDMRNQQISKVEAWVGHKISPLQPSEVDQLQETLKGMPPAQAASTLSTVGQMIGDSDRIAAVAKQLHDRDGTLGEVMAYGGDQTATGQLTGELILKGAQALKDKTSLVDTTAQSGWKATIATAVRGAFSSQTAEDQAIDAAYKITAANGGDTDAAIKAATGGIITHGQGKIPLPINMDESTFNKRLSAITPQSLASQLPPSMDLEPGIGDAYVGGRPITADAFVKSLPDATLVHAGQGMYVVKAGTSFVTNKAGQRIVLRISQ